MPAIKMYKLIYFKKDYECYLRTINHKLIEMVTTSIDKSGMKSKKVITLCEDGGDGVTMGNVFLNEHNMTIYHVVDGVIKKTKPYDWSNNHTPPNILDYFHRQFGIRRSHKSVLTGISYTIMPNEQGFRYLKIESDIFLVMLNLSYAFSINCDTGIILMADRVLNIHKLTIYRMKSTSIKIVHTEEINVGGTLVLDAEKMKITMWGCAQCWKIDYQPKTLLTICREKVEKFKRLYDLLPKEALTN